MANALASPAPVLDVLPALDELRIELCSNRKTAWAGAEDYRRVGATLHAKIRQSRHELATMMGDEQGKHDELVRLVAHGPQRTLAAGERGRQHQHRPPVVAGRGRSLRHSTKAATGR
jgi:hypothetical protein